MQLPNWFPLEILRIVFIIIVGYTSSYLVKQGRLRVNYSRKIVHFSHILSSLFINGVFLNYNIQYFIASGAISLIQLLFFSEPIRKRFSILNFFFLSYDRPEDRPHTVRLAFTQLLAMNVVLILVAIIYESSGLPLDLLAIPMYVTAFGDGLAEPVGVRFGRNKYKVTGLFTDRTYTRSYEGSLMVTLATIGSFLIFRSLFNWNQLILLLMVMPFVMTLTEAKAPHTWDNPFLYLVASSAIYLVFLI